MMRFWGVEVKPGEPLKVKPEFGTLVHISQAALGEVKNTKEAKNIPLRMKIDDKNFIIGSLDAEERTQIMFDLVFEKEFELSHDLKNASVYFIGYVADDPENEDEDSSDEDISEDEALGVDDAALSKPGAGKATLTASAAVNAESSEDEDSSDDDYSSNEGISSSSDDEEVPQAQQPKKRPAQPAQETPVPAKKAKLASADKTGNKNGQAATPIASKANGKSPKSGAQPSFNSSSKSAKAKNARK